MRATNRLHGALAVLLVAGGWCSAARAADVPLEQIDWLTGCWRAVDADTGSGEMWTSAAGGTLLGMSRTIKGGKTVSYEFMRIGNLPDGNLAFFAQPSGKPPATFAAIKVGAGEVVFENLEHDFPQRVFYRLQDRTRLQAGIEGLRGGTLRSIQYPMERTACPAAAS